MINFLYASATGAVLILVIVLLRALLQRQVRRGVWLLLWSFAVLRLLLPFSMPSRTSVYNLPVFQLEQNTAPQIVQVPVVQPTEQATVGVAVTPQETRTEPIDWATYIWIAGAISVAVFFVSAHLISRRKYRFSLPLPQEICVPDGLQVRMLDGLASPVTYGLFRPTVLMPVDFPWQETDRLQHILLHEQAHIRCHDILRKYILLLTVSLHWFNPFVWLMLYLATQDMEMRCDAMAVQALGGKMAYAKTLVDAEAARLRGLLQTGFSFSSTASRLKALIKGKQRPVFSVIAGIVLALIVVCCFMTGKSVQAETPSETEPPIEITTATPTESEMQISELPTEPITQPAATTQAPSVETTVETTEETAAEMTTAVTEQWTQETETETEAEPETTEVEPPYTVAIALPSLMEPKKYADTAIYCSSNNVRFISDNPQVVYMDMPGCVEPEIIPAGTGIVNSIQAFAVGVGTANIYLLYEGTYYLYATITVVEDIIAEVDMGEYCADIEDGTSRLLEFLNGANSQESSEGNDAENNDDASETEESTTESTT